MAPCTVNLSRSLFKQIRKNIAIVVLFVFVITSVKSPAFAQVDPMPFMPKPGVMVHLSPEYTPAYLKGIVIHPENALKFDFIIYKGDKPLTDAQKREEYTKLTKYFLASLAIPDDDQWVNLSPYEKDRIIKDDFGKTEMGRDLLAQDYMLKQITASLIYPQETIGKKFWDKVYTQAQQQYGTTNIPVNTFNKVWILPDDALIYEKGNTAYVLKNHLRVMLEEDYLSLQKHSGITHTVIPASPAESGAKAGIQNTHSIASNIIRPISSTSKLSEKSRDSSLASNILRAIVLPELQREVNEDKNFAPLRQVYSGMLLATWYKRALKESLLSKIYANKAKVKGVDQDPQTNEEIYRQYLRAYKKGVFNFIKEDVDKYTNETIPRKYFSGGALGYTVPKNIHVEHAMTSDQAEIVQAELRNDKDDLAMFTAEEQGVAIRDAAMNVKEFLSDIQAGLGEAIEGIKELSKVDPKYNVGQLLMSNSGTFQGWFLTAHERQKLYHTLEHSLRVANFIYHMVFNRWVAPIDRTLYPDKWALALKRAIFMFQVGLMHDFDPNRPDNTPARALETLRLMELDWNGEQPLGVQKDHNGQEVKSVLKEVFGWTKLEYLEARLMIYLTDFPKPEQHLDIIKDILRQIYDFDRTGEELIFVLQAAYMLQEFADKGNGYMILNFNDTLQLIEVLAKEINNLAEVMKNEAIKTTAEKLTKNTYKDFLSKIGKPNDSWFIVFQQLLKWILEEEELPAPIRDKFVKFKFPDLEEAFKWMPPGSEGHFKANLAGLDAIQKEMDKGSNFEKAKKEGINAANKAITSDSAMNALQKLTAVLRLVGGILILPPQPGSAADVVTATISNQQNLVTVTNARGATFSKNDWYLHPKIIPNSDLIDAKRNEARQSGSLEPYPQGYAAGYVVSRDGETFREILQRHGIDSSNPDELKRQLAINPSIKDPDGPLKRGDIVLIRDRVEVTIFVPKGKSLEERVAEIWPEGEHAEVVKAFRQNYEVTVTWQKLPYGHEFNAILSYALGKVATDYLNHLKEHPEANSDTREAEITPFKIPKSMTLGELFENLGISTKTQMGLYAHYNNLAEIDLNMVLRKGQEVKLPDFISSEYDPKGANVEDTVRMLFGVVEAKRVRHLIEFTSSVDINKLPPDVKIKIYLPTDDWRILKNGLEMIKALNEKRASLTPGGIDFNAANLNLQIKRDGKGVPLPISQQDLENIHIDGLIPVILDIKPAMETPLLSELQAPQTPQAASAS